MIVPEGNRRQRAPVQPSGPPGHVTVTKTWLVVTQPCPRP
ncbi:hypothetical protein FM103_06455 [Corynebacterium xerosis]|nr:hypothetical protein FM103_06455 [Corynebacterium xerosis]